MRRPLFAAAVLLTAVIWILLASGGLGDPPPWQAAGVEIAPGAALFLRGQICRKEEQKIWLQSVTILSRENTFLQADGLEQNIPDKDKIICEISEGESKAPLGSRVTVLGTFASFSTATNPGEFDAGAYYRSLGAIGRLRRAKLISEEGGGWPVREAAYQVKQYLKARLNRVLPPDYAGIMATLLLGERGEMTQEWKELYKRNGILHIFSISSLHITMIGMSIYRALRKGGAPIAPAAIAGSAALLLYGTMVGFTVSACRAIGMYLIRMGAEILGRSYDTLTALGILLAAMVLRNPYLLQNTGFLLSFSSVLGLAVLYPALGGREGGEAGAKFYGEKEWRIRLRKVSTRLRDAAAASFSITLATLPVQLWYLYETPVYSVAINLLILPLLPPLLGAGFFSLVPGLGAAAWVDRLILWAYEFLCQLFDRLPFHTWNPGRPALWQIFLYEGLLLAVVLAGK